MRGIAEPDQVGSHKEAAPKRVEWDKNTVQRIVTFFKSSLTKRLLNEESDSHSNIANGVVLPTDVAKQLLVTRREMGTDENFHTAKLEF